MGLTYQRDAIETECCMFLGSYSSDDDIFGEGQMARFVTKTLKIFSGLVVLTYCT